MYRLSKFTKSDCAQTQATNARPGLADEFGAGLFWCRSLRSSAKVGSSAKMLIERAQDQPAKPLDSMDLTASEEPSPAPGDIIIVDDNPVNLGLLEDMLLEQGYEVRSFPLGRLALAAAIKMPPGLFLLDINMPEMDGYQVCERLQAIESLAAVPVIFLSALNDTQDKVKAFR